MRAGHQGGGGHPAGSTDRHVDGAAARRLRCGGRRPSRFDRPLLLHDQVGDVFRDRVQGCLLAIDRHHDLDPLCVDVVPKRDDPLLASSHRRADLRRLPVRRLHPVDDLRVPSADVAEVVQHGDELLHGSRAEEHLPRRGLSALVAFDRDVAELCALGCESGLQRAEPLRQTADLPAGRVEPLVESEVLGKLLRKVGAGSVELCPHLRRLRLLRPHLGADLAERQRRRRGWPAERYGCRDRHRARQHDAKRGSCVARHGTSGADRGHDAPDPERHVCSIPRADREPSQYGGFFVSPQLHTAMVPDSLISKDRGVTPLPSWEPSQYGTVRVFPHRHQ